MKSKRGFFAITVDLEKAYDKLNWKFIKSILYELNLLKRFMEIIMNCVTTSFFNNLWNKETIEEFTPNKVIRQGDQLSLYLFITCMKNYLI